MRQAELIPPPPRRPTKPIVTTQPGNVWSDLAITDLPQSRWAAASGFYSCCATSGGLLAGGYVNGSLTANISNTTIIWDSGTNTWTTLNQMMGERSRMGGAAVGCNFYTVGGRSAASPLFVGTVENQKFTCPCSPTPTPTPFVSISGTVTYCSNPGIPPVPGVLMSLTGPTPAPASTSTNGSGFYTLGGLFAGNSYTVTPTKTGLVPGAAGIDTVDVIAIQRHFLVIGTPLTGCKLTAADVNGIGGIDTVDVIAVQRFFLTLTTGIANTGKYSFTPASRSYSPITSNQTGQNYDAIVFGDVASSLSTVLRVVVIPR